MQTNYVGLDLGQRRDFTAIAVVERDDWMGTGLALRHLERMPLGTPYTKVVERVCGIMRHPKIAARSRLVVDATGVGAPVVELLRSSGIGTRITAVTITGGDRSHGRSEDWYVPRKDLLTGLEMLLENGGLRISRKLGEATRLVAELTSIRAGRGESREHDDLVMAVALACWSARLRMNGFGPGRLI